MVRTLWMFKYRFSISVGHYPTWHGKKRRFISVRNNGGRKADECLDINWEVGTIGGAITLWQIGVFEKILRFWK